jgi:IS5 family transposase
LKAQILIRNDTKKILKTNFCNGKKHDFNLYKTSNVAVRKETAVLADTGYLGIRKLHENSTIPKKKSKRHPLTKEEKRRNRAISRQRIAVENVLCMLKRFRILSDRYRNRRKRFGLRFNLIAGVYNYEV